MIKLAYTYMKKKFIVSGQNIISYTLFHNYLVVINKFIHSFKVVFTLIIKLILSINNDLIFNLFTSSSTKATNIINIVSKGENI